MDSDRVINIGVAAHITGAAPGGPRYDPRLTTDERQGYDNGIHLCQNDGKLVDANPEFYTVAKLRAWKMEAERHSFEVLTHGRAGVEAARVAPQDDLAAVLAASVKDAEAFKRDVTWPRHPITLKLRMVDGSDRPFEVSGLAAAITTFNEIALIAQPGFGKTTTLLQTAEAINARGEAAAIFVRLGEWSAEGEPLFQSILGRSAFSGIREEQLRRLAESGRLVLLLDGWNELDAESQRRLAVAIRQFRRDYPDLGIIISTRRHALAVPINGRLVEIDALSQGQQLEIARALRGSDGEAILDHAWRTPGVRELVATPLYLTTLVMHVTGGAFPTTREEVLRLFIDEHERPHDKALALREALQGCHQDFLVALATGATKAANTSIPDDQARANVVRTAERLVAAGQMQSTPKPMAALDVLVSQHVLIRLGTAAKAVSFQHQQFQEWYASLEVERLIQLAQSGDAAARKELRETVLNAYPWEEPILFACERMSQQGEADARAIANTIIEAIGIDPMLAALMIQRSTDQVWEQVRGRVMEFVERWHTAGTADRALRFMIDTGRADFAAKVWPVIANPNDQVHLEGLRAGRRFRPSVLGADAQARIAALPGDLREHVISEIASRSGMDGMELAVALARAKADPAQKSAVIEALLFRRADRLAVQVLETAPDEVWVHLARQGYANEFSAPAVAARLQDERRKYLQREADPMAKLRFMIDDRRAGGEDHGAEVQRLIAAPEFPMGDQHATWAVNDAYERYPNEVVAALLNRLENGREIPHAMEAIIRAAGVIRDDGPLAALVLQGDTHNRAAAAAVSLIGPDTTGRLIDAFRELDAALKKSSGKPDDALRDRHRSLHGWILKTPVNALLDAVVRRGEGADADTIMLLAELIGAHGELEGEGPLRFDPRLRDPLCEILARWADILLASPQTTRKDLVEVARAIGRVADQRLLPVLQRLLTEDLARWTRAREERRACGGPQHPDAYMTWTNWYAKAFAAFDGGDVIERMRSWLEDTDFGDDAARVLVQIWERMNGGPPGRAFPFDPPLSKVRERRAELERNQGDPTSSPFADMILAVADALAQPEGDPAKQALAMRLATVAMQLPHGNQTTLIERLLGLPQPRKLKLDLLKAIAQAGGTIRAAAVMEGFGSLLEEAKTKAWLLQKPQRWELDNWLELFPFCNDPLSIMRALEMLKPEQKQPWQLRHMLSALRYAPEPVIEPVLVALAEADPRLVEDHHWNAALERCDTESAARVALNLVARRGQGQGGYSFTHMLARGMRASPAFRAEVYACFEQGPAEVSAVLEPAIAEAADDVAVRLLIWQMAAQGRPFESGYLRKAIEHVVLGQQASTEMAGAYEVFSVPAAELRKALFGIAGANVQQSALAAAALSAIDEIRDDYGAAESEPRHPDIAAGRPWPQV